MGKYSQHILQHSNTVLCLYTGVYQIRLKASNKPWVNFICTPNCFNTSLRVDKKFELRGFGKNRFVSEDESQSGKMILKDINFQSKLFLSKHHGELFLKQCREDVEFLSQNGIVGYSLLVGIHEPKCEEEVEELRKSQENDLINNIWKSKFNGFEGRSMDVHAANPIYFLCIIDFFQTDDEGKILKGSMIDKFNVFNGEREFLSQNSEKYAERFLSYLKSIVLIVSEGYSEVEKVGLMKRAEEDLLKEKEAALQQALEAARLEADKKAEVLAEQQRILTAENLAKFHKELTTTGIQVMKHPRKGKPDKRVLFLAEGKICCGSKVDSKAPKKSFSARNVIQVCVGVTSETFQRTLPKLKRQIDPKTCLSVLLTDRTVDLEFESVESCSMAFLGIETMAAEASSFRT